MPVLFQQVARIARRGRKRWLGLMFVTQLPQHLSDEALGLINNYILHKLADANVISRLTRPVGSVNDGLWNRLPNLAPGQANVSAASMAHPLLLYAKHTKIRIVRRGRVSTGSGSDRVVAASPLARSLPLPVLTNPLLGVRGI